MAMAAAVSSFPCYHPVSCGQRSENHGAASKLERINGGWKRTVAPGKSNHRLSLSQGSSGAWMPRLKDISLGLRIPNSFANGTREHPWQLGEEIGNGGDGGDGGGHGGGDGGSDGGGEGGEEDNHEGSFRHWGLLGLIAAVLGGGFVPRPCSAIVHSNPESGDLTTRQTFKGAVARDYAETFRQLCRDMGYKFCDEPMFMNIVGVRSPSTVPGAFDDHLSVLYRTRNDSNSWVVSTYTASTDPGKAWLMNKMGDEDGTAILCPGQYIDGWEVGKHKGNYEALVESKNVRVWRDRDRDGILDFGSHGSFDEEGFFGVNIHHAGIKDAVEYKQLLKYFADDMVSKYSAGCQVIATVEDHSHFMKLMKSHISAGHQPYFTYTLFQGPTPWNSLERILDDARAQNQYS